MHRHHPFRGDQLQSFLYGVEARLTACRGAMSQCEAVHPAQLLPMVNETIGQHHHDGDLRIVAVKRLNGMHQHRPATNQPELLRQLTAGT